MKDNKLSYLKVKWGDHIVEFPNRFRMVQNDDGTISLEPDEGDIFQSGTPVNAGNLGTMDDMIDVLTGSFNSHDDKIMRIQIQMELDGRAPGNSGTFADDFEGTPNKLIRQTTVAVLTAPRAAGTTVLNVDTTDGFKPFTEVTVYDGTNSEDVLITDVTASTITVQPLVNDYVKGARIGRSNAKIANGQMTAGDWGTYDVTLMEVM